MVDVTAATQGGSSTTYSYTTVSGPSLAVGQTIVVAGMKDGSNDGTFTISGVTTGPPTTGTFAVTNSLGVSDTGQNGTGTVPIACNPDLVAVKP